MEEWAGPNGPYTLSVVNRIFDGVKVKEQTYRAILSVLNLSKKYSNVDLEAACALALTKVPTPRYKQLKTISHPERSSSSVSLKRNQKQKPHLNKATSEGQNIIEGMNNVEY